MKDKNIIVIIEDDFDSAELLKILLEEINFKVVIFFNIQDIATIKEQAEDASIFLVDVWINGEPKGIKQLELLNESAEFSDIPKVILSSDDNIIEEIKKKNYRVSSFIHKPFSIEKIIETIQKFT